MGLIVVRKNTWRWKMGSFIVVRHVRLMYMVVLQII